LQYRYEHLSLNCYYEKSAMSEPQSYIIVENEDGTFTAYVNFGMFQSKEEAETSLDLAMKMLGLQMNTAPTVH
jgi:hypothetical protein